MKLTVGSFWGHSVTSQWTHKMTCCELSVSLQLTPWTSWDHPDQLTMLWKQWAHCELVSCELTVLAHCDLAVNLTVRYSVWSHCDLTISLGINIVGKCIMFVNMQLYSCSAVWESMYWLLIWSKWNFQCCGKWMDVNELHSCLTCWFLPEAVDSSPL